MATRNITKQRVLPMRRNKCIYRKTQSEEPCAVRTCTSIGPDLQDQFRQGKYDLKSCQGKKKFTAELFSDISTKLNHCKMSAIVNRDIYKFYKRPIVPFVGPETQLSEFSSDFYDVFDYAQPRAQNSKNKGTQTDYRDSEAQTVPWEPPYKIRPGHKPEVLTLAHLTWGHGLPAGKHEIEIINRMRIKRTWEAILPPADTPENVKKRRKILAALEIDEWAFRESEIQVVMELRMKLMEELSEEREAERSKKIRSRFERLDERLKKFREKRVNAIRHNLRRDLRKLRVRHANWRTAKKRDVVTDHTDPRLYASRLQCGVQFPPWNETSSRKILRRNREVVDDLLKAEEAVTVWPSTFAESLASKPRSSELCARETRWTEEKLRRLHEDLRSIRLGLREDEASPRSLLRRRREAPAMPGTPLREDEPEPEDDLDESAALIRRIVRGRAVQCMMYEGRDRCRELIDELRSTHALEEQSARDKERQRENVLELQREQNDRILQEERLCEILNSLEGMTVAGMLDYLSKELIRLQDERRAHAFALLAERERCKREAEEAGRRQQELNRRREYDEMFRQIVKVNQETVEVYLEDIIKESIEWVAEKEATEYILKLCDKADEAARDAAENATELEQEEMVADMIYNFVLPEVEKRNTRRRLKEKQERYLRSAHQAIYEEIMNLPPVEPSKTDESAYHEQFLFQLPSLNGTEEEVSSSESDETSDVYESEKITGDARAQN